MPAMKNMIRRDITYIKEFSRSYSFEGRNGAGFRFESDENGVVDVAALKPAGLKNLLACQAGVVDGTNMVDEGVSCFERKVVTPGSGECDCGRRVTLSGFTNTCECGADYNMGGQMLAPREQWGECEGDSLSDILAV
jgi:hypothetical protein